MSLPEPFCEHLGPDWLSSDDLGQPTSHAALLLTAINRLRTIEDQFEARGLIGAADEGKRAKVALILQWRTLVEELGVGVTQTVEAL